MWRFFKRFIIYVIIYFYLIENFYLFLSRDENFELIKLFINFFKFIVLFFERKMYVREYGKGN